MPKKTPTVRELHRLPAGQKRGRIAVRFSETELAEVQKNAQRAGMPVAVFLRFLGLGYTPPSIIHNEAVLALTALNGQLGKIGGLIKMALGDGDKTVGIRGELRQHLDELAELRFVIEEQVRNVAKC